MAERLSIDEMAAVFQAAQCPSGKVPHLSRSGATEAARVLNQKPPKYGPAKYSYPYKCERCNLWHVGRKS